MYSIDTQIIWRATQPSGSVTRPECTRVLNGAYESVRANGESGPAVPWAGAQWRRGTRNSVRQRADNGWLAAISAVAVRPGRECAHVGRDKHVEWRRTHETHVTMERTLEGAGVSMRPRHMELTEFAPMGRGFHWIS